MKWQFFCREMNAGNVYHLKNDYGFKALIVAINAFKKYGIFIKEEKKRMECERASILSDDYKI